jgi:hypothetical protein
MEGAIRLPYIALTTGVLFVMVATPRLTYVIYVIRVQPTTVASISGRFREVTCQRV